MQRVALTPGTRLGELEIKRVLADGGFGIVYLARDHALDRDVAVKEFMPAHLVERGQGTLVTVQSSASAESFAVGLRAFIEEAKLLASFSHPAIVKVYRFWEANGTAYMLMPYLHGPTLSDVRRSMSEPPTEAWMRSMIEPLLDALSLLHSRGVCHRDVAPDNVIVTAPGEPVLLDFGAARRLIGDPLRPVTSVVKPSYAPIEQYAEATHLQQGPWTDLYGLAALVAYLIDGKPPLPATTRCVHDDMVPLSKRKIAGVSTRFLNAIEWAFAVRPHDRPHSVAALREALDGRQSLRVARWRHDATWLWRRALWAFGPVPPNGRKRAARHWVPLTAAAVLLAVVAGSRATLEGLASKATQPPRASVVALASHPLVQPQQTQPSVQPQQTQPSVQPQQTQPLVQAQQTQPLVEHQTQPPAQSSTITPAAVALAPTSAPGAATPAPEIEEFIESEPRSVVAESSVPPARAAARRAPHKTSTRKPEIEIVAAGPREMCSGRNFFLRPYCMARLCSEARFNGRAECAPRPARNEHY